MCVEVDTYNEFDSFVITKGRDSYFAAAFVQNNQPYLRNPGKGGGSRECGRRLGTLGVTKAVTIITHNVSTVMPAGRDMLLPVTITTSTASA